MSVGATSLAVRRRIAAATGPYRRRVLRVAHRSQQGDWARTVMNERVEAWLGSMPTATFDVVEVSGDLHAGRDLGSYRSWTWPDFDVCAPYDGREQFDLVICEQVLEHVRDPWAAARTLRAMTRPGGHVLVSTPFLLRIHEEPGDYWRFTEAGLRLLLEQAGLRLDEVGSWGNRDCVRGNFTRWVPQAWWRSRRNEREFPVVVWAFAST
jgi:SAM-dependent methyltransferase